MKNVLIALLISSGLMLTPACKNSKKERADEKNTISATEVPATVQTAFTAKYPGATELIWEDAHEGTEGSYKIKFKRDDKYWKAEFRQDGSFIKEKLDD